MKKEINSFVCAFRGILSVIKSEAHMRFHIVASVYVVAFGLGFYNFSKCEWAVLIVLIAGVFAFEIVNTAIERLCDAFTLNENRLIKLAKDAAAGAVLVLALASVIIAFLMFWNIKVFTKILMFYTSNIFWLVVLILSIAFSVVFIKTGFVNKIHKQH